MEPDQVLPFFAIAKELSSQFALAYSTDEFAGALRAIAEGEVDVAPMVTGTVGPRRRAPVPSRRWPDPTNT